MSHNKRLSRRRHHQPAAMENHIAGRPRIKLWAVFSLLFIFWYLLLYGFDWSSLPGLSSLSHNSLQSLDSNPNSDDDNIDQQNPSDDLPQDLNHDISRNQTAKEFDQISITDRDLTNHEKELEQSLLPKEEENNNNISRRSKTTPRPCEGRYIYVHDLPPRFNSDYIKRCELLNKWHNMCVYFTNGGLGERLQGSFPMRLFQRYGWYATHQFSLEVIFHNRMKQYQCLTNDSSIAAAIYVPYYPGLDVSRYLWDPYASSVKDADTLDLFEWLRGKPEWGPMGGRDHFLVSGRITWDFRRAGDNDSEWGNKLMILPESQNMTMITIESSPWHKNDFAIPYPTYFHPSSDAQVYEWQNRMRRQKRRSLFCFAGAPRPNMEGSIRGDIMSQCSAAPSKCKMIECKDDKHNCLKPANVMRMFQSSIFCLQPPGDSFTRRSTFDSILAGCIPVFFSPGSAYVQYLWHLPKDYGSYSVLIPEGDVKAKKVSIERVLAGIPRARVLAMREKVIELIPNVIYADPRSRLEKLEDAFDLAVKGVVERVGLLRREMREGRSRNYSEEEFDEESSWKYYTFGTTQEHEWDHYFKRYR